MLGVVAKVADQNDFVDAARGHNILRLTVYAPPVRTCQAGVISVKL